MGRVFANGFNPRPCHTKDFKMVHDASLLNTQLYNVLIKGKVEQSRERSSPSLHLSVVAIEKEAFWSSSTKVTNFTLLICFSMINNLSIGQVYHGLTSEIWFGLVYLMVYQPLMGYLISNLNHL